MARSAIIPSATFVSIVAGVTGNASSRQSLPDLTRMARHTIRARMRSGQREARLAMVVP